jgi:hypothetical protein
VTGTLLLEVRPPGASEWKTASVLGPADQEGSISDTRPDGVRDVILFRCEGGKSVISRSGGGIDFEEASQARVVLPFAGRETLAELGAGEVYERDVRTDRGTCCRARWTHRATTAPG